MRYGWSLNKSEWDNLRQSINETSWKKTLLDQLYRDSVPSEPGVYMICAKTPKVRMEPFDRLYSVIYVGRSTSLRNRFLDHCKPDNIEIVKARNCLGNKLDYWFAKANHNEINSLEAILINCLGPVANRKLESITAQVGQPQDARDY